MVRKKTRYNVALFVWFLVVMAATIAIFSGQFEPIVDPTAIPGGPLGLFGFAGGLIVLGLLTVSALKKRAWTAMGRETNFVAESTSLWSTLPIGPKPDLAGTVDGRPVRARTFKRKTSNSGSEGGSKHTTYTVVETDLDEPADDGVLIGRTPPGESDAGRTDIAAGSVNNEAVDDRFVAAGGSPDLAREILASPARDRLLEVGSVELLVGDAVGTMFEGMPDVGDSLLGKAVESKLQTGLPDDPGTVSNLTKGVVLDPAELGRQAEAMVATADAFEARSVEDEAR